MIIKPNTASIALSLKFVIYSFILLTSKKLGRDGNKSPFEKQRINCLKI